MYLPTSASFTPVVSKTFTAPTNGVLYITGAIQAADYSSPGSGSLYYRLRLDSTPLTTGAFAHELRFEVDGVESGAVTGVVPVTKGAHTVHLDALAYNSLGSIRGRELSVLFVPNG
jgi:hypothetical protein